MSDAPIDAAAPKRRRGMLGFYLAGLVLVALAVFGAWFWTAWDNWQFDEVEAQRRQAEAARQLGLPVETAVDLGDGVKLDLVLIPPGMFDMGSPDSEAGRFDREGPLHRVRVSRAFYIGKYEVTQEQWEKLMGMNPSNFKGPKRPVEQVAWDDCQDFLIRLNAPALLCGAPREGRAEARGQFRLPTEAEWEWACRAGTKTRFHFGDDAGRLGDYAWFGENAVNTTYPVGEKLPNAWGLHDCHGNVWEWCSDRWGSYSANPWPGVFRWTRDPQGCASGFMRVMRGGGWPRVPCTIEHCRSASRCESDPTSRSSSNGFRVVFAPLGP